MSPEPLTIDEALNWDLAPASRVADRLATAANGIESDIEAANRAIQESDSFFEGDAGNALRTKFDSDRRNVLITADLITSLKDSLWNATNTFAAAKSVLARTVAEIQESEYELFYTSDGDVLSRKSNLHWLKSGVAGIGKLALKEAECLRFRTELRTIMNRIQEADLLHEGAIEKLLELLPAEVKDTLITKPTDTELARILKEYQVSATDSVVIWPSGTLLDILRSQFPDIKASAMSEGEAAALTTLAMQPGGLGKLNTFYQIQSEAAAAAESIYPDLSASENRLAVNDGHADAFRHAYWNARLTQEFGPEWTATFTSSHEQVGSNPAAREAMDLYNNELGRSIATANHGATPDELKSKVLEAVNGGKAIVIVDSAGGPTIGFSNSTQPGTTKMLPGADIPMPNR
ncbi:DUF6973 domain-containing protein [Nocardia thailandica]